VPELARVSVRVLGLELARGQVLAPVRVLVLGWEQVLALVRNQRQLVSLLVLQPRLD